MKAVFLLSMTPFMILFVGAASVLHGKRQNDKLLYQIFAILWLVAAIYFGLFAWSFSLPFFLLGKRVGDPSPIVWIVSVIDCLLFIGFAVLVWRRR